MAYYINGKAFTDHPLMDEIVYNCKLILKGVVVKNDVLANSCETTNSINNAEMLALQIETGRDVPFDLFVFSEEILLAYGYSQAQVDLYLRDKNQIPVSDRYPLTLFANEYFREHFEEENNYYRMLNGLPPFDSGELYYIWLTTSDIPSGYTKDVDYSLPLHEQPRDLINVLYADGIIDRLRKTYPGSNYSYMNYLGEKKISVYDARKAQKWDIIYMPSIYYLIEDKFLDFYKINRETYMNRSYQDYFSETGEYYDQMMILIVLCQTFADMVTDVPQWYIRRDIFDIKSCKYFLESAGVAYFKEIPLKYQIRIVKNLNRLIQNKSSNQNLDDILDVFDIDSTNIYKYWLYKKPTKSGYDLEFIMSNYKESYDNYIKDTKYRVPYDTVTLQDKYWDGEKDHDDNKKEILDLDFTIQGTKYMAVEYEIEMSKYMYQMEYMLGLILDSNTQESLSEIRFGIPSINETAQFRLSDIFLFLVILTNEYYQFNSDVIYPDDISEGPEPEVNEEYYDWLKKTFPKAFVLKNGRVYGFNSDLDKDALIDYIKRGRHSHFRFGAGDNRYMDVPLTDEEYYERAEQWIEDLGINDFIVPKEIYDIDTLVGIYDTNTEVYEKVKEASIYAVDHNDKKILEYIFQELFTRKYDIDMYKYTDEDGVVHRYTNLVDMIKDRDFILYEVYLAVTTESNIDSKRDMLRGIMNDILDTLEYYLSSEGLEYIYSFVAINSPSSIVGYLYDMFNFFKSYKVYFLDPYYTLITDDPLENTSKAHDRIDEFKIIKYEWDASKAEDYIVFLNMDCLYLDDYDIYEYVDIYGYYDPDPSIDLDFDGIHAEDGESVTKEIDGGTADDYSAVPYIEANGGGAYLGSPNISDINGAEANEYDREYFEIDGGYAFDIDFMKTDAMGTQMFNYEIDGGGAGKRKFMTNTFALEFIGTEFIGDVRISNKDDSIEVKEDGLFVDQDAITSITNFETLKTIFANTVSDVKNIVAPLEEALQTLVNPNRDTTDHNNDNTEIWTYEGDFDFGDLEEGIDPDSVATEDYDYNLSADYIIYTDNIELMIGEITHNMEYAVKQNTNDYFYNKLKNHVDSLVECLNNEFPEEKINPYIWNEL